jgi:hypothetical protein
VISHGRDRLRRSSTVCFVGRGLVPRCAPQVRQGESVRLEPLSRGEGILPASPSPWRGGPAEGWGEGQAAEASPACPSTLSRPLQGCGNLHVIVGDHLMHSRTTSVVNQGSNFSSGTVGDNEGLVPRREAARRGTRPRLTKNTDQFIRAELQAGTRRSRRRKPRPGEPDPSNDATQRLT